MALLAASTLHTSFLTVALSRCRITSGAVVEEGGRVTEISNLEKERGRTKGIARGEMVSSFLTAARSSLQN
ncbi:hypothetical protein SESBI_21343 [Sesbania bispinosa]|nr:hypothetical protein SESBI_21343 [Sesbania bispinosa]